MTHAAIPDEEKIRCGMQPGGIRLSLGLEDWHDIIADLEDALDVAAGDRRRLASVGLERGVPLERGPAGRPAGVDDVPQPPPVPLEHPGHAGVLDEFIRALKTSVPPQTECGDNLKSLAMVMAAIESAAKHKRVKIKTRR
jgi:hypothetical protein